MNQNVLIVTCWPTNMRRTFYILFIRICAHPLPPIFLPISKNQAVFLPISSIPETIPVLPFLKESVPVSSPIRMDLPTWQFHEFVTPYIHQEVTIW